MFVPKRLIEEKLKQLLAEDVGLGDATASAVIPEGLTANAVVIAKNEGVVAGLEEAVILAEYLGLHVQQKVDDGEEVAKKQVLLQISGDAQTILCAERTLLNLLSRMSGIATATRSLVDMVKEKYPKLRIAATRKSAPGLLYFDKKAVIIGSGDSHRLHLDDMVLIKDNHLVIVGSVRKAVEQAKANASFSKKIEVEVTSIEDLLEAAKAGADIVMLDNFAPKKIGEAVESLKKQGFYGKVLLEVSGGITHENLLEYAASGVDIVSLGELTHSVKALDASLEIVSVNKRKAK